MDKHQNTQPQPAIETLESSHLPAGLSEFVSALFPPIDDGPVLAIRVARGPSPCKYELLTARYFADKRSWRDINGDIFVGAPIMGWKNAMRWFHAL